MVLKVHKPSTERLDGPVAQLVRAPPCHGGGHGFDSRWSHLHKVQLNKRYICSKYRQYADVAQLAEQLICNQQVIGSSPIIGLHFQKKCVIIK